MQTAARNPRTSQSNVILLLPAFYAPLAFVFCTVMIGATRIPHVAAPAR
jgi:hypothetical protein